MTPYRLWIERQGVSRSVCRFWITTLKRSMAACRAISSRIQPDKKLPTLLHIGDYDATAEELYGSVDVALERGNGFAAIDGPGQGATLYDQRVPMRPDWEAVVPGMVDALIKHPAVNPERIVLVGRSFGGLIAPRRGVRRAPLGSNDRGSRSA